MTPSQTLSKILTDYGCNVLQNPRQVEALFKDLCFEPEHKREVNLLILALKENIPNELTHHQPVNDMLVMRLIKKMDDAYFIPAQQAYSTIEMYAKALNIALPSVILSNAVQPQKKFSQPTQSQLTNELEQGVWTDPKTGLMWARISIGQQWINGQCVGEAKEFNWEDAHKECQNFRLAGFNDWRLPIIDELKSLMLHGRSGYQYHCPINTLFQPKKNIFGFYWSCSPPISYTHGDDMRGAWNVGFDSGYSYYSFRINNHYVRAVRTSR